MPFNVKAMTRRRTLLGITQHDLAITAGIAPSTIQKLEQGKTPNDGSNMGIDICMRIAMALQMEVPELLIPPTGNRYQRAVQFAKAQHDPAQAPKLHDRGRSVRAESYRRLTGDYAKRDALILMEPEVDDASTVDDTPDVVRRPWDGVAPQGAFRRDPSSE